MSQNDNDLVKKPEGKRILVAPLNWGLGHAARCIPIIRSLAAEGFTVIIGSDGSALQLLKKEFPMLQTVQLPSYNIRYARRGRLFKFKLVLSLPHIRKAISAERKLVKKMVNKGQIDGIISDNRLGIWHKRIPSVYITHQLNVLSGSTSWISSKAHRKIIRRFDECWVPDIDGPLNLSGKLGHLKSAKFKIRYIGVLSRMHAEHRTSKYDLLCILSGPEPQRSLLEELLLKELSGTEYNVLLVRGVIEEDQQESVAANVRIVNFMMAGQLQDAINESEVVIARSGYTTVMDLAAMGKKAFFIPTPGQYEQEYLAKRLHSKGIIPYCKQDEFKTEKLKAISDFKGFSEIENTPIPKSLFRLFKRKGKF